MIKERDTLKILKRNLVAHRSGHTVYPQVLDIHPAENGCNMDCAWCIGRDEKKPLKLLEWELLENALGQIYVPEKKEYWPTEVHFCGCSSDPLLNHRVMKNAVRFLQDKAIIKVITNGAHLERYLSDTMDLLLIDKLSISLDVTNERDFQQYKRPQGRTSLKDILCAIKTINEYRPIYNPKLSIYVTFVATPATYSKEQWAHFFSVLRDLGVNHIQVRNDYTVFEEEFFKKVKAEIAEISEDLGAHQVRYDNNASFDIKYNEYLPRNKPCDYCMGYRLWPTIGADLSLYPCAHVANSSFHPLLNLSTSNYYSVYEEINSSFELEPVKHCHGNCPSLMYFMNHLSEKN